MMMMRNRGDALEQIKWRAQVQRESADNPEEEFPIREQRLRESRNKEVESQEEARQVRKRSDDCTKSEATKLNRFRMMSIVLWVAVTCLASFAVFRLSKKQLESLILLEFHTIASKVIDGFLAGINSKMASAYSISTGLTGMLPYEGNAPNITFSIFDELAMGALLTSSGSRVVWSPFLRPNELIQWEAYTQKISHPDYDMANVCYVCGNKYGIVGLPQATMQINNTTFLCGDMEVLGLAGLMNIEKCKVITDMATMNCSCQFSEIPFTKVGNNSQSTQCKVFQLVNGTAVEAQGYGPFAPVWQVFPSDAPNLIMYDQTSDSVRRNAIAALVDTKVPVLGGAPDTNNDGYGALIGNSLQSPSTAVFVPVFETVAAEKVIGSISIDFEWGEILKSSLPAGSDGATCVIENSLGHTLTFKVENGVPIFEGANDFHEEGYGDTIVQSSYADFMKIQRKTAPLVNATNLENQLNTVYRIRVYSSGKFHDRHSSSIPTVLAATVFGLFLFNLSVFIVYDCMMKRRQDKVVEKAMRTDAIVSSLFPPVVRDRLLRQAETTARTSRSKKRFPRIPLTPKLKLRSLLRDSPSLDLQLESDSQPIADLFQQTTVLFADIAGFTAWSSSREPCQVFKLLESVYSCFDSIAHRLGVFKVETVGDCYVAVTGVPEPQEDHAVIMSEFAYECLVNMRDLVKQLETTLGPGTADLALRVGMHSGPVTAGVLRGEKSRFQLFGDTMNTASRMESTGKVDRIQVSQVTADLLIKSAKTHWLIQRNELVFAKGKGDLQTYWVKPDRTAESELFDYSTSARSLVSLESLEQTSSGNSLTDSGSELWRNLEMDNVGKLDRLIDWNVELLLGLIHTVVARRTAVEGRRRRRSSTEAVVIPDLTLSRKASDLKLSRYSSARVDVVEAVNMPRFSDKAVRGNPNEQDLASLGDDVRSQLRDYVARVAALHRVDNPFHNFEHASNSALSANKLMKRIVNPENVDYEQETIRERDRLKTLAQDIHDATFGISSDPLMHLAVVFAALIHDVDHPGVPNEQLVNEEDPMAVEYKGKSVIEQHALETAWRLFMEEKYDALRHSICASEHDLNRFHQLVVNAVIATDIEDDDLSAWRQNRWNKAFGASAASDDYNIQRKATIVYESVIQASDVAYTMQHWQIYSKWNERLFAEKLRAFLSGRSDDDPSFSWYHDELGFLDNYVIPLAKRLGECQVFGVSSEEYLTYALGNRNEWEVKGRDLISRMIERFTPRMLTRQSFSASLA